MASIGRSSAAAVKAFRSAALRSRGAAPPPPPPPPPLPKAKSSSLPRVSSPFLRRSVVSALGSVESLMPLHSAIASARLRSFIASDSSYWSCLSQGLNKRI
ncbi:envelope glycoprotein [Rhynchospora pubera]|uniref:Envelope glycoprotein n=1 Tax=Rhynchospora pubera TaxID=906938 RepID=A0AAV8ENA1_9POAL|nr:envelope glycoprotein [Rhynchospora pubera]